MPTKRVQYVTDKNWGILLHTAYPSAPRTRKFLNNCASSAHMALTKTAHHTNLSCQNSSPSKQSIYRSKFYNLHTKKAQFRTANEHKSRLTVMTNLRGGKPVPVLCSIRVSTFRNLHHFRMTASELLGVGQQNTQKHDSSFELASWASDRQRHIPPGHIPFQQHGF